MNKEIIDIRDLIKLKSLEHISVLQEINYKIKEAYYMKETSVIYEFSNPYRLSEKFKSEILDEIISAGYSLVINNERLSLIHVIKSVEISWKSWFSVNRKEVNEFFLLGQKIDDSNLYKTFKELMWEDASQNGKR